jgi:hypothetical protein
MCHCASMYQLLTAAMSGQIIQSEVHFTKSQNLKLQDLMTSATLELEGQSTGNMHMQLEFGDMHMKTPSSPDMCTVVEETMGICELDT